MRSGRCLPPVWWHAAAAPRLASGPRPCPPQARQAEARARLANRGVVGKPLEPRLSRTNDGRRVSPCRGSLRRLRASGYKWGKHRGRGRPSRCAQFGGENPRPNLHPYGCIEARLVQIIARNLHWPKGRTYTVCPAKLHVIPKSTLGSGLLGSPLEPSTLIASGGRVAGIRCSRSRTALRDTAPRAGLLPDQQS